MKQSSEQILNGWKEIAVYLNRGIRTVQRWERYGNLPVHRALHMGRSAVIAIRSEIDGWVQSRPLRTLLLESGDAGLDRESVGTHGALHQLGAARNGQTVSDGARDVLPKLARIERAPRIAHDLYRSISECYALIARVSQSRQELAEALRRLEENRRRLRANKVAAYSVGRGREIVADLHASVLQSRDVRASVRTSGEQLSAARTVFSEPVRESISLLCDVENSNATE
ncbi:MAG TPA: hypothetical protein VKW06_16725 [Candidatus Angelobacter sp.]|nr:hypothetical protein [Candidatus Angelobacter sp.]